LIREAAAAGSRLHRACAELGLSLRTFQRWVGAGDEMVKADSRTTSERPEPANKLSEDERARILSVANSEEFASLPPSQIVPTLADRGEYVASESSIETGIATASSGPCKKAVRPRCDESLRRWSEPGLELGYHVVAGRSKGSIPLLVHGAGRLQQEDRSA
jgi:hypothetical protein